MNVKNNYMKTIFTTAVLSALSITTFAQDNYEKMYYNDINTETDHSEISASNAVGLASEVKLSLKIANTSNNFILFNPEESKFILKGKDVQIVEKAKIISPEKSKTWTVNGLEGGMNKEKEFSMNLSGLYEIKEEDKSADVPELKLPLAKNSYEIGDMTLKVLNLVKETSKTSFKLNVKNKSDKYIIVYPSRVSARMPDGNLYSCDSRKAKPVVIEPKSSEDISIKWDKMPGGHKNDMQIRDMLIQWEDVFYYATPQLEDGMVLEFKWDETITKEKN
jgi:hypothetical protein